MLDSKTRAGRMWGMPALMALLLAACVASSGADAGEVPARVLAIGDIHGEYAGLVSILREVGLIDSQNDWVGGEAVLVQTGDFMDRGPGVRPVMDLLMKLEHQAPEQDGRVVVLLGNHEGMNLIGDFRDVTPEIYATFATDDSEKLRQAAFKEWGKWLKKLARSRGGSAQSLGDDDKVQWMAEHPLGRWEYQTAVGPEGEYGHWIARRPIAVKIGDTIFMHAGIGPKYAHLSLEEITDLYRGQFETLFEDRASLAKEGIVPSFFDLDEMNSALIYQVKNPPIEQYSSTRKSRVIDRTAANLERLQALLLEDSPLWYRGYTNLTADELSELMAQLEETYGARHFVVAHSPLMSGDIQQRLGGRVFLIDTGMLASFYQGRPSALEWRDGDFAALYADGERQTLMEVEDDAMVPAGGASNRLRNDRPGLAVPAWFQSRHGRDVRLAALPPQGPQAEAWKKPERVIRGPDGNPLPFDTVAEIEEFLRTAKVVSVEAIPEGVTKPKKVLLDAGGVQAHAKFGYNDFKGQGEKLADGTTEMYFQDSYKADMAAYKLSQLLGMEMVPPAVVRQVEGQDGIVQIWIEGLISYESWLEEGNTGQPSSLYFQRQIKDMKTFDLLIRNIDRHQRNINWDSDWNVWLIDHTRSLAKDGTLRKGDSFKGCSRDLYQALQALKKTDVEAALSPYQGNFEIKALLKRRDKLLKLIEGEIKKQGEDKMLFNYGDAPTGLVIRYDETAELAQPGVAAETTG